MDEFDLGSLRANEEDDDILKETIESPDDSAVVRRVSMLSPREESDRLEDLPRSAIEVNEDRLWKVT